MSQIYAIDESAEIDKKQLEFMLTLARVFMSAAFATDSQKQIGEAIKLARKSSSIDEREGAESDSKKTKEE